MARTGKSDAIFFNHIITPDGFFAERSKDPKDGFEPYYGKDKQLKYYRKCFNTLSGIITSARIKKVDFGGSSGEQEVVDITLNDNGENLVFSFQLYGSTGLSDHARALAKYVKNIDINYAIEISHERRNAPGKSYPSKQLYIKQNGTNIKQFYTKENLPAWKPKKVAGKDSWDSSEQDDLLYNALLEFIDAVSKSNPIQNQKNNEHQSSQAAESAQTHTTPVNNNSVQTPSPVSAQEEEDELPF